LTPNSITYSLRLRALLPALAVLILPLALGACIGVEQEVDAPPSDVVVVDEAAPETAAEAEDASDEENMAEDADEAASEEDEPADDAEVAEEAPADAASDADAGAATGITAVAPEKLNLNTASREDFLTVPNAGEKMAKEFDEYRPYATIGQFRAAIGKYVDDEQVAAYEEFLFVPVDPVAADAATMMQIPGMTEAIAEAMVSGQPYDGAEAFLAALAALAPDVDVAAASGYLTAQ
jgi:DNA uptake protein ComE-like DNA-binding protein